MRGKASEKADRTPRQVVTPRPALQPVTDLGRDRRDGLHTGVGARDGRQGDGVRPERLGEDEGEVCRDIADRAGRPEGLDSLSGRARHHGRTQRHHLQLRNVCRRATESISRNEHGRAE